MRFVLFYHSALSDWNHGNAHFLRGVVTELQARGHDAVVYEPIRAWSAVNLVARHGRRALARTQEVYPDLHVVQYVPNGIDLDRALDAADVVIVHEWNDSPLVEAIGRHHVRGGRYVLLFHDTHHRSVTDPDMLGPDDLDAYDGVLAFGEVIRQRYLTHGWTSRAWTWHEAADVRVFRPLPHVARDRDLVWIGNWGDDERAAELEEFLVEPVRTLGVRAAVHGVRYPPDALSALSRAGIDYRGWLPNYDVPHEFARHRVTVHVPRRPYVDALPGIPTIRPFEALACGIPLVSAPWRDEEHLFRTGEDYLVAADGAAMTRHLRAILHDPDLAGSLAASGLETIRGRHTCGHRVDELLTIVGSVGRAPRAASVTAAEVPA